VAVLVVAVLPSAVARRFNLSSTFAVAFIAMKTVPDNDEVLRSVLHGLDLEEATLNRD
jgi:hypothetical protein